MRSLIHLSKILVLVLIISITVIGTSKKLVFAADKPEIFAQMGHRGDVGSVVFSQDLF